MKIIAVNKGIDGYLDEMQYDNKEFNGHQVGVAVCVTNNATGDITDNFSKKSIQELQEMLDDKTILLLEEKITQVEGGKLVPKTVYSLPYYVEQHSISKPTVNNQELETSLGMTCYSETEILFVHDGLNRYVTVRFASKNTSLMDLVYDAFSSGQGNEAFLESMGIHYGILDDYENAEEYESADEGYILDFYNETGARTDFIFGSLERLRDSIMSMRLINCEQVKDGHS